MKRTFLLPVGIASATILVVMAFWILITGTFYLIPTITIDPVSEGSVDGNGILVLTGTTNLPLNTHLLVNVSPASGTDGTYDTEITSVSFGSDGKNSWTAFVNASGLSPGKYLVRVSDIKVTDSGWTILPGAVTATNEIFLAGRPALGPADKEIYLRINTVGPTAAGKVIYITGTTNLPPGTEVAWKVDPASCPQTGTAGEQPVPEGIPAAEAGTVVTKGIAGVHRWSCFLDSTGMSPGCYQVTISGDGMEGTAGFVVSDEPSVVAPLPSRFVTIDTIPDPQVNTMVVLTGTTSLPAGADLNVAIIPNMESEYDFLVNPKDRSQGASFSGVVGTVAVEEGAGGINLWSFGFDTYRLNHGLYSVEVSIPKMNMTISGREPGDILATMNFTIRREPA